MAEGCSSFFCHRHPVHQASVPWPLIVERRQVLYRLVVPYQQVANAPLMQVAIVGPLHFVGERFDQGEPLFVTQTNDSIAFTSRGEDVSPSGDGVSSG